MQEKGKQTRPREEAIIRDLLQLDDATEIIFNDCGWTSRVYIIRDGEIAFKFPRNESVKEEYRFEVPACKTAHHIRGDVLIPEILWEHPDRDYIGYRGVVGAPLDQVSQSLSKDEKAGIGAALGTFLKQFHQQDLAGAPTISLESESAEHEKTMELSLPTASRHFTHNEVSAIRGLVSKHYPARMAKLGLNKGLCHGDLGYWNMIHSGDRRVGIIDFGDTGYRDVSIDFAGMTDVEVLDAALAAYGSHVEREKIELQMRIIPILDLTFFVGKEDQQGIERTVRRIREVSLA
ncbi:MAG: hypothetical protein CSA84_02135 [Actinomycetales bacterium]|nr:MAG: hypothetical protein CSA84_02135 [Actinomycetales bacterium]